MRYLVTFESVTPFFTHYFDAENHFIDGMTVYDLVQRKYTTDGKTWNDIEIDVL
jgi:hypothetical protein